MFVLSGVLPFVHLTLLVVVDAKGFGTGHVARRWGFLSSLAKWAFLFVSVRHALRSPCALLFKTRTQRTLHAPPPPF